MAPPLGELAAQRPEGVGETAYQLLCPISFVVRRFPIHAGGLRHRQERGKLGTDQMFGDGAHIIYVNGEMRDGDTALARLMHDFFCTDPAEMYYPELARTVAFHKTDSEEVRKMSGVFETFAEEIDKEAYTKYMAEGISIGKEQGISIGKEQGISIAGKTFARRLLEDGFSIEDIARYTSLSPEAVRALAERSE